MTEASSPPVRVQREGWRRFAPLTREQVRKACLYAEVWAREATWRDVVDLIHGVAWMIGEQLKRPVSAHLSACHDIDDMPIVRVQMGEFEHHIAFRETRILENNTTELLLGDVRIEEIVAERMREAKERQGLKAGKARELEKGKIR